MAETAKRQAGIIQVFLMDKPKINIDRIYNNKKLTLIKTDKDNKKWIEWRARERSQYFSRIKALPT